MCCWALRDQLLDAGMDPGDRSRGKYESRSAEEHAREKGSALFSLKNESFMDIPEHIRVGTVASNTCVKI